MMLGALLIVSHAAPSYAEKTKIIDPAIYQIGRELIRDKDQMVWKENQIDIQLREMLLSNQITTVEEYLSWLRANIQYESDGVFDNLSEPLETVEAKSGDCEDFAMLSYRVLKVLGFKPMIVILDRHEVVRHAITTFKEGDRYSYLDNMKLVRTLSIGQAQFFDYLVEKESAVNLYQLNPKTHSKTPLLQKTRKLTSKPQDEAFSLFGL